MCAGKDGSPLDISVSREWLTPMRLRESETIESEPRPLSPPPPRKSDWKRELEVGERGEKAKNLKKMNKTLSGTNKLTNWVSTGRDKLDALLGKNQEMWAASPSKSQGKASTVIRLH